MARLPIALVVLGMLAGICPSAGNPEAIKRLFGQEGLEEGTGKNRPRRRPAWGGLDEHIVIEPPWYKSYRFEVIRPPWYRAYDWEVIRPLQHSPYPE